MYVYLYIYTHMPGRFRSGLHSLVFEWILGFLLLQWGPVPEGILDPESQTSDYYASCMRCLYMFIYICIHICTYVSLSLSRSLSTSLCLHVYLDVQMHACMHTHTSADTHMYMYNVHVCTKAPAPIRTCTHEALEPQLGCCSGT